MSTLYCFSLQGDCNNENFLFSLSLLFAPPYCTTPRMNCLYFCCMHWKQIQSNEQFELYMKSHAIFMAYKYVISYQFLHLWTKRACCIPGGSDQIMPYSAAIISTTLTVTSPSEFSVLNFSLILLKTIGKLSINVFSQQKVNILRLANPNSAINLFSSVRTRTSYCRLKVSEHAHLYDWTKFSIGDRFADLGAPNFLSIPDISSWSYEHNTLAVLWSWVVTFHTTRWGHYQLKVKSPSAITWAQTYSQQLPHSGFLTYFHSQVLNSFENCLFTICRSK